MGRRKNSKDDLLFSLLLISPWWVSLVIGLLLGLWIALFSNNPLFSTVRFSLSIAVFGVSAVVFLAVNITQNRNRNLLAKQKSLETIRRLSWQKFEQLVAEAYRQQGYIVTENRRGGADGGIDLVLCKHDQRVIVQCKHWKVFKVGVKPIRELYGVMMHEKASQAIFVTSGSYTAEARAFACDKPLLLIDGKGLLALIGKADAKQIPTQTSTSLPDAPPATLEPPTCPRCGGKMVLRTARHRQHVGNKFWGCADYPRCRGIVDISS